jgi:hypothetical protein
MYNIATNININPTINNEIIAIILLRTVNNCKNILNTNTPIEKNISKLYFLTKAIIIYVTAKITSIIVEITPPLHKNTNINAKTKNGIKINTFLLVSFFHLIANINIIE